MLGNSGGKVACHKPPLRDLSSRKCTVIEPVSNAMVKVIRMSRLGTDAVKCKVVCSFARIRHDVARSMAVAPAMLPPGTFK